MDEAAIADIFSGYGSVRCRRMFGGIGIYADGLMFALVVGERIYLKTDDYLARTLAAQGSEPFVYQTGARRVTVSYWSLPEAALDDPGLAADLAGAAFAVARRAADAKAQRRRRPVRAPLA